MFFDDFFDDDFGNLEDFAFVGGGLALIAEELEEERRIDQEIQKDMEPVDEFDDTDILDPIDGDPYP